MTETTPPKKSDLGVRAASAVVMVAVAGTALWLGGWVWTAFVALVALGVLWEWRGLSKAIAKTAISYGSWLIGGLGYVGIAVAVLWLARNAPALGDKGVALTLMLIAPVIATDVGAYFAGRSIGGPKIAPSISPSKTWAGLIGGMLGASVALWITIRWAVQFGYTEGVTWALPDEQSNPTAIVGSLDWDSVVGCLIAGSLIAIVAQSGDFFESWMKRRAGVKDSSNLIPGHGGLFDRLDGLLAVGFVLGLVLLLGKSG